MQGNENGYSRRRFLGNALKGGAGLVIGGGLLAACGDDDASGATTVATTGAATTGGATTAATGAATTTAPKPAKVAVGMGWIKNVEYGGSWIALENGYYTAEGLTVDYRQGGPNAPASTVAVAAGDADIGVAASMQALLQAIGKDNDFVIVATQYQVSPGAVLSLAKKPVKTPKDLVGIKFLGQEAVDKTIDAVLVKAGLPKDYTFVKAGFTPDPLLEGAGDAYSCFAVNQPITLEGKGLVKDKDFFVTTWAELGLPSYSNLFFCKRSYLQQNRDVVVRFLRATIKGWEANVKDPAKGAQLAVSKYGVDLSLDLKQQTRQNELQIPLMQSSLTASKGLFRIDPALFGGEMYKALEAAGVTGLPDVAKVLDLTVLDEVYGSKTSLL
jgi:ABC-type nitrate/sulfonate/bicarbonate transport system substrate-binding protein